jgi:hypothetical protein
MLLGSRQCHKRKNRGSKPPHSPVRKQWFGFAAPQDTYDPFLFLVGESRETVWLEAQRRG